MAAIPDPRPTPNISPQIPRLVPRSKLKPEVSSSTLLPPPKTQPLPPPPSLDNWSFTQPCRRILSKHDHELFLNSPTYSLVLSFVFTLSDAVRDTPNSAVDSSELDPVVSVILEILDDVEKLLSKCPAEDTQGSRFGNKAFRSFVDEVGKEQAAWHRKVGVASTDATDEISVYFQNSFGNSTRIDYGSGHELNFILWLLCLNRLGFLPPPTFNQVVLRVFTRYLRLMRAVQMTYYLEPAGSHGVWGLDDYQFLPFLFGASQLLHHKFIRPKSIHQSLVLEEYGKEYMYLDQVAFVNSVKNVEGLRWHSPMLDDISAAKNWEKIEGGMRKMFLAEVLGKLPVMQHFLFGSIIPAVEGMGTEEHDLGPEEDDASEAEMVVMKDGMKHVHTANSWGDCCGIKVPSSIGAAEEMKKRMGTSGLRRLPFD